MIRIALALLLLLASNVNAQEPPLISLFGDMEATVDEVVVPQFMEINLYILAHLDMERISGIRGAEFALNQVPANLGSPIGTMQITWEAPEVFGDILYGINLGWPEAQPGPIVLLGTMTIIDLGGFNFDDYVISAIESACCGKLELIDHRLEDVQVDGGDLILNAPNTASRQTDWGAIKALY
ncbi:MAG: hypothetical protein GY835_02360 [bacterium]|nr:hypothetical protein [bacterium]